MLSRLSHPNFVSVFETGVIDGVSFIAMELLQGRELSSLLREGPLTIDEAASLVAILARAIHHAHSRGIVHRDLKPGNVIITRDGTPKILDLGLALEIGDRNDARVTSEPTIVGTIAYMAPEQACGEIGRIGPAADVYSLGAMLYEILTGRRPFRGASPVDTLRDVVSSAPVPPSKHNQAIPRDLETICLKCLEKEPGRRYQTAAGLAADLERFCKHRGTSGFWGRFRHLYSLWRPPRETGRESSR